VIAPDSTDHEPIPHIVLLAALAAALLALGIYLGTLHPGVGPSIDSIELHTAALVGGVIHPPGSPQYLMLGRLMMAILPGHSAAYRLNLFSALCAAAAVGVVYLLCYRLSHHFPASLFASLTLVIAPRFWYQANIAELYALNSLYVAAVGYLLLTWHQTRQPAAYWAATALYALSFGNHLSMILLLPMFLYAVAITDQTKLTRPVNLLITAGIVLLAAAQYLYIPLRAAANPPFCNYCPGPLPNLLDYVRGPLLDYLTGGPFKQAMFGLPRRAIMARLPESMGAWGRQFMPWGLILGVAGAWDLLQKDAEAAWLLLIGIGAEYAFVMGYDIPDWHDFLTPCYVLFAPLLGYGALRLWLLLKRDSRRFTLKGQMWADYAYPAALTAVGLALLVLSFFVNIPLVDQSEDTAYEVNGLALLAQVEPGAWLLMPHPDSAAFYYSWAVRYLALAARPPVELTVVTPEQVNPPPGPAPYYLAWADAAPQLEPDALLANGRQILLLDPGDERAAAWGLLPICTPDGESIAGYEVVAVREGGSIQPLMGASRWEAVRESVVFFGEAASCPD
jgi:hypothetical protein